MLVHWNHPRIENSFPSLNCIISEGRILFVIKNGVICKRHTYLFTIYAQVYTSSHTSLVELNCKSGKPFQD